MKRNIVLLFVMFLSFSTYAESEQEKGLEETCKELAAEQEIASEYMDEFINECLKNNIEEEGGESKE